MTNTQYGKIIDGVFTIKRFNTPIVVDNVSYITTDPEIIIQAGWKKLVRTEPAPAVGCVVSDYKWVENENNFTQVWNYAECSESADFPSIEERIKSLESIIGRLNAQIQMLTEQL